MSTDSIEEATWYAGQTSGRPPVSRGEYIAAQDRARKAFDRVAHVATRFGHRMAHLDDVLNAAERMIADAQAEVLLWQGQMRDALNELSSCVAENRKITRADKQ